MLYYSKTHYSIENYIVIVLDMNREINYNVCGVKIITQDSIRVKFVTNSMSEERGNFKLRVFF